jgi:flagellin-like protein
LSPLQEPERASSPIFGIALMIGITIILAVIVLKMCLGFHLPQGDEQVPVVFKIMNIDHTDGKGKMIRASYLVLKNIDKKSYPNRYLMVRLFVNDNEANLLLPTLNGDASCNVHHYGFQNIGGLGTHGGMNSGLGRWYPDQTIWIDFNNGMFGPGDTIRIEVYDSTTGKILSRDTYPPENKYTVKWFYNYFLNPQAA